MTGTKKTDFLKMLRDGEELSLYQQIIMIVQLCVPAILAQLSSIVMQYIDASMVGSMGPAASASIALMTSSTWLMGGIFVAVSTGFTVQVAHRIGAKDEKNARNVVRIGLISGVVVGVISLAAGVSISGVLPLWLGGSDNIRIAASQYFMIYSIASPVMILRYMSCGMIQCSGNMKLPSILNILMCFWDVIFNFFLIFPCRYAVIGGLKIFVPGFGLGVRGAALGTVLADVVTAIVVLYYLLVKSPSLHLVGVKIKNNELKDQIGKTLKEATRLAVPVAAGQLITGAAYVAMTAISAPLGTASIAAHSFSITAESFVYMPGYGMAQAATTLVGQSKGANRGKLTFRLGWLCVLLGMSVMTITGIMMYFMAPWMIGLLSPDPEIRELGTAVLRIEAFAEPFYAASIVGTGVFRGAGDTIVPSVFSLLSMWFVRIPLAYFLAPRYGLQGMWIAMATELTVGGILFLGMMFYKSTRE